MRVHAPRHFSRIPIVYQGTIFECSGDWDPGEHLVDNLSIYLPKDDTDLYNTLKETVVEDIGVLVADYLEEDWYDQPGRDEDPWGAPV